MKDELAQVNFEELQKQYMKIQAQKKKWDLGFWPGMVKEFEEAAKIEKRVK